jgi:hypothetical protein
MPPVANVDATNDWLAARYITLGDWIGLGTGPPGNTATVANEAVGGSPAYTRQETSWSLSGATAIGTPVTFNVGPGTYRYMLHCSASSGNNMVNWVPISPQVISVQTTITIVPTVNVN